MMEYIAVGALALLAALGLVSVCWLAWGCLLFPIPIELTATLVGKGDGGTLEQGVRGLLWLRRCGLWQGNICLKNGGLSPLGLALAHRLAREPGVELEE